MSIIQKGKISQLEPNIYQSWAGSQLFSQAVQKLSLKNDRTRCGRRLSFLPGNQRLAVMRTTSRRAFTLVEMSVVVAIIGILYSTVCRCAENDSAGQRNCIEEQPAYFQNHSEQLLKITRNGLKVLRLGARWLYQAIPAIRLPRRPTGNRFVRA